MRVALVDHDSVAAHLIKEAVPHRAVRRVLKVHSAAAVDRPIASARVIVRQHVLCGCVRDVQPCDLHTRGPDMFERLRNCRCHHVRRVHVQPCRRHELHCARLSVEKPLPLCVQLLADSFDKEPPSAVWLVAVGELVRVDVPATALPAKSTVAGSIQGMSVNRLP